MNDNAKAWVQALRSGKYLQARRTLGRIRPGFPIEYCCLGVACELYLEEGGTEITREIVPGETEVRYNYTALRISGDDRPTYETAVLPPPVREWLGLARSNGEFGAEALSSLNDRGATFFTIADIIESEPSGLFAPAEEVAE